jgi:hypothetical protein
MKLKKKPKNPRNPLVRAKKPKKPKKPQKTQKNPEKPKKTHWAGFFKKKTGFFPTLPGPDLFCLSHFEGTFTSFFTDKRPKRRHKTVEIKGFLTTLPPPYRNRV